jgi:hypothetical protein
MNNNKSNAAHSLTEVLLLVVQEGRADTVRCVQDEHNSTAQWLKETKTTTTN